MTGRGSATKRITLASTFLKFPTFRAGGPLRRDTIIVAPKPRGIDCADFPPCP